jgi:3-methyladenine DNA glycosylase AlkD
MAAYMRGVAPFLGIRAADRRLALRYAWKDLPNPTSDELGSAALLLMAAMEREFHYAASDLIGCYRKFADESFLSMYATQLLTEVPWWDTVDAFVSAGVSPLARRYDTATVIEDWSESSDIWLIRAAIGHQRGWKHQTDVGMVLRLSDRHWDNPEFFVAKAIGWALRDLVRVDPAAVREFLKTRRKRNAVAEREARRGLDRVT